MPAFNFPIPEAKAKIVILESPYAGDIEANTAYARAAMLDSLNRGEAPMVSHLLYTQVLDDTDPGQRHTGIEAGLAWGRAAELTAVYVDRGISAGMIYGIENAQKAGRKIEYRRLNHETDKDQGKGDRQQAQGAESLQGTETKLQRYARQTWHNQLESNESVFRDHEADHQKLRDQIIEQGLRWKDGAEQPRSNYKRQYPSPITRRAIDPG